MNFLSPAFLLGLPLIGVPVIIHLLSRRHHRRIPWGAMRFLLPAVSKRRRLWRLSDLLLLLLRTLAVACLVGALARPLLTTSWLGGSAPREVIVVLDPSLSLARSKGGSTLFKLQLQEAHRVLDDLHSKDGVRVLLASTVPVWLTTNPIPAEGRTLRALRSRLDQLQPTLGTADVPAALREALDLEAPPDKAARVIHLLTDAQRQGWRIHEPPLWTAIQSRLSQTPIPTTIRWHPIEPAPAHLNLAVDDLLTPRPYAAAGGSLAFAATVRNHGPDPSPSALLTWRVGDQPAGVATVPELSPGGSVVLSLQHRFETVGVFELTAEVDSRDDLPDDNTGRVIVEIVPQLPVLLVEDRRGQPLERQAGPFLLAALGAHPGSPSGARRSVFNPTLIDYSTLATTNLAAYQVIVALDPPALPDAVVSRVEARLRQGGGLWIATGETTDAETFNRQWQRGGLGPVPLPLLAPVGDPGNRETFSALRTPAAPHPATVLLADLQRLDLDRARLYRRHPFASGNVRDVSVLLQTDRGEPVAIERQFDRGRVIALGVPLGIDWSTLPLCQAYVAMVHEWLWYLCEPGLPRHNLVPGETLVASAAEAGQAADLLLPDQRTIPLTAVAGDEGPTFRSSDTRLPGLYQLRRNPGATGLGTDRWWIPRDANESDLTPLTSEERRELASHASILGAEDPEPDAVADSPLATRTEPRQPLEGTLLTALALALLGEMLLARWTGHQRTPRNVARVPAVTVP